MEPSELIKNRAFLAIAGGVALTAVLGGAIYFEREHIQELELEGDGLRGQIQTAQTLVRGTPDLVKKVVIQRETDEVVKAILPNEEDINNFVRTLRTFEEQSGVRITAVKKKPLNTREKRDFDRVVYQLTFEGSAFGLMSFVHQVESDSRFMSVPSFKLAAATRDQADEDGNALHRVTLDVETYVYEPQQGPAAQDIEGYERKVDQLGAEIDARREELVIRPYEYLGQRNRRDPFVDPRTPADSLEGPLMTIEEQMGAVASLVERVEQLQVLWEDYASTEDFQLRVETGVTFEELLFSLEEDVRLVKVEGRLKHLPAEHRFRNEVVPVVADLRAAMGESLYGQGPGERLLEEAIRVMEDHLLLGQFEQALAAFGPLEAGLDRAAEDEDRAPLVAEIRDLEWRALTALDFDELEVEVGGVIVGDHSVALIGGRSVSEGEMVAPDLFVREIREDQVEFVFRGVALSRLVAKQ